MDTRVIAEPVTQAPGEVLTHSYKNTKQEADALCRRFDQLFDNFMKLGTNEQEQALAEMEPLVTRLEELAYD